MWFTVYGLQFTVYSLQLKSYGSYLFYINLENQKNGFKKKKPFLYHFFHLPAAVACYDLLLSMGCQQ
jgi:hypothetical protein